MKLQPHGRSLKIQNFCTRTFSYLFFFMKSSGCFFTTWCSMNHVMEQCIHAMDNNFPIRKNISLNTTHFLSSFHILKQEPILVLHKCSSPNDHIVSLLLLFIFSTCVFLFWLHHMCYECLIIGHQTMLCWQKVVKQDEQRGSR